MPPSLARMIAPRAQEVAGPHPHIHTYTADASTAVLPQLDTMKETAYHTLSVYGLRFQNKPALAEKSAKFSTTEYPHSRSTFHT